MNQDGFEERYNRKVAKKSELITCDAVKAKLSPRGLVTSFLSLFPILQWLPKYNWKKDVSGDIIGGLTVGIMHVPQGMAYATLASLPPVYGMYSSFFTSTVYMFFGTSRHVSVGVFAVGSLMVGAVRLRLLPDRDDDPLNGTTTMIPDVPDLGPDVTPVMITSALAFGVGIAQVVMAMLRLGFLTTYMSDALVCGFTTGSAFHVFIAQLNKVIGVKLPRYNGFGMLFLMVRDLIFAIPKSNYVSLGLSVFGITFLSVGRDYVNPWVKKRSPVPLPLELILVIIATIFSYFTDLKANYNVKIVDFIPQGVPVPSVPRVDLVAEYMISDSIAIGIVSYMFVISMAKLFAKKRKYQIDPGQDLYACGFMHLIGSFFPMYPAGASLSRSAVCEGAGTNTQLYTLFSSTILLAVILWMGPLLQPLPMCILACIVMVSLKSLFLQFRQLPKIWKISKFDFMVWVVSCFATVTNDCMTGLTISVAFCLISVVLREQWPKIYHMAQSSDHEIVKPDERYKALTPFGENVRVMRFESPLHFANVASFKHSVDEIMCSIIGDESSTASLKMKQEKAADETNVVSYKELSQKEESSTDENSLPPKIAKIDIPNKVVIVDCGAISYIDTMGLDAIKEIHQEGAKSGIDIHFANVTDTILDMFEGIEFFSTVPRSAFFPTVQQAVLFATSA